ncbi:MAG: orotidine-5'-phosphate decarboxylase [Patescibacteria group bacterium]
MKNTTFTEKLQNRWSQIGMVCVGLDPVVSGIPEVLKKENPSVEELLFVFNSEIIDATADLVCAYKPNIAFYEAEGEAGMRALKRTISYIKEHYDGIPVILDAKRADIGSTSEAYARAVFDELGADAVTVNPYLGHDALEPFLERKDKGIFVLAKTSNPGAGDFQNSVLDGGEHLWEKVVRTTVTWNTHGNCGLVGSGLSPETLATMRTLAPDMPILVPGIGAQGGDVEKAVLAGRDQNGKGLIINSSRGIIFASSGADFAQASRKATESLLADIKAVQ